MPPLTFTIAILARALGFPDTPSGIPSSYATDLIESARSVHTKANSRSIPSMLLDTRKGQPIEVEVIVGEVVRMAKSVGVEIPVSKINLVLPFLYVHVVILNGFVAYRNPLCSFACRSKPSTA